LNSDLSQKKEIKEIKNPLLEGPELITLKEIKEEEEKKEKEGIFIEASRSETRGYQIGINKGKPFILIEYYNRLPDELTEEERKKFKKKKQL
jgi:hypothetical protein